MVWSTCTDFPRIGSSRTRTLYLVSFQSLWISTSESDLCLTTSSGSWGWTFTIHGSTLEGVSCSWIHRNTDLSLLACQRLSVKEGFFTARRQIFLAYIDVLFPKNVSIFVSCKRWKELGSGRTWVSALESNRANRWSMLSEHGSQGRTRPHRGLHLRHALPRNISMVVSFSSNFFIANSFKLDSFPGLCNCPNSWKPRNTFDWIFSLQLCMVHPTYSSIAKVADIHIRNSGCVYPFLPLPSTVSYSHWQYLIFFHRSGYNCDNANAICLSGFAKIWTTS